jgi:23S rRNA (cytosine1962-C5)-methyltransferase
MQDYELIDCGDGLKIEKFGQFTLIRPCPQAIWKPKNPELWKNADSQFSKTTGEKGIWKGLKNPDGLKRNKLGSSLPENWEIKNNTKTKWKIEPNEYGNVGVFPEHWTYTKDLLKEFHTGEKTLSLFSYTGTNTVDLVKNNFKVTVVDSSKNAIEGYTYNLGLNSLSREGQRLILEDVNKFLEREIRRKSTYKNIICDSPSFGRGTKGEVFDIEKDFINLIFNCSQLLEKNGKMYLTLHSPRFTLTMLSNFISSVFPNHRVSVSEILNPCQSGIDLPSGYLVKIL